MINSAIKLLEKKNIVLLLLLGIMYVAFVVGDVFISGVSNISSILKYIAILVCLVCAITVFFQSGNVRDARLQIVIMCFTVVADYFLLFTSYFTMGILIFLGAHLTAIYRYCASVFKICTFSVALAFVVWLVSVIAGQPIDLMFCAVAAYMFTIITATIATFIARQAPANNFLSRCGMILFLLCDVNVALYNTLPASSTFYAASMVLMWVFYLPAQTMLSMSAYDFDRERM